MPITTEERRAYNREWARKQRKKNPDKVRSNFKAWRLKNLDYCAQRHKQWIDENRVKAMLLAVKSNAKKKGIFFDLSIDDIVVPEFCPVLGIPLKFEGLKNRYNSPSVDRFDNTKGYVKDNIRIISWRANHLKSDGTVEEMEKVLRYMRGELNG